MAIHCSGESLSAFDLAIEGVGIRTQNLRLKRPVLYH